MKKLISTYLKIGTVVGAVHIIRRQLNALWCPGMNTEMVNYYNEHPFRAAMEDLVGGALLWPLDIPILVDVTLKNNDGGVHIVKEDK
jgi:hypothetical protein